jgi:hypothetical protein
MSIFDTAATPINGVARKLALAAAGSVTIPQGAVIRKIFIRNKTANAVTGGIKIGTTVGGTDVLAAQALAASAVVSANALIDAINTAAVRTLYIDAVTAWNSASVDVAVEYTDLV